MNSVLSPEIHQHISRHRQGYSLAQEFYCSNEVFRCDMDHIFTRQWLLVDHVSRIPHKGDYFLFKIGGEEIIIIRQDMESVGALYNVCRHRGSRVCLDGEGHRRLLTCPYHAWSYNLDGSLRAARLMPENFERSDYGLHRCHLRVFHGLIFVCLCKDEPPDFDARYGAFGDMLDFQGIAEAKIAVKRDYPNGANWKLVVENFIECYHCAPAHPEYCRVHPPEQLLALGAGPGSGPDDAVKKYQARWDEWKTSAAALGHPFVEIDRDENTVDMAQLTRFPINDRGFVSETRDGKSACKRFMGNITDHDYGETAFSFNPVAYILAFNDFAMMARFTPRDAMKTDVQISWLVHKDSEEGADYDPDNVAWIWDVTVRQDKRITENNQAGIQSSRYQPGPYSEQELRVVTFTKWYLRHLAA